MGFWNRKRTSIKVSTPETVKIEGVPTALYVEGIPHEIKVKHEFAKIEVTLPTEFQHLMKGSVKSCHNVTQPNVAQPNVPDKDPDDDIIKARQAETAEKINQILKTKGEQVRRYRQSLWDSYIVADRRRQIDTAKTLKAKIEAIDEILK